MERPNAWKDYTPEQLDELHYLCEGYKAFISDNKTERECCAAAVSMAEEAGYVSLASRIEAGEQLKPGDKVYAVNRGKSLMLLHLGTEPLERGVNILGAHIDSPRLDVKQDPVDEKNELVTLDTHYYGGIKKYQVGHHAAGHPRRRGQEGWLRGERGDRRGRGRPGVLRHRPAPPPGQPADGQEGL